MLENNKAILEKANAAITAGDNEGFLSFCSDDTLWTLVGDKTLKGKDAVRQYMATAYTKPPRFTVERLIAGDEFVTALGTITMEDEDGNDVLYSYCDVWKFRDGKMVELKAFVTKDANELR